MQGKRLTEDQIDRIRKLSTEMSSILYEYRYTYGEIAEKVKTSIPSVAKYSLRRGKQRVPPHIRQQIYEDYKAGATYHTLELKYKLVEGTIRRIVKKAAAGDDEFKSPDDILADQTENPGKLPRITNNDRLTAYGRRVLMEKYLEETEPGIYKYTPETLGRELGVDAQYIRNLANKELLNVERRLNTNNAIVQALANKMPVKDICNKYGVGAQRVADQRQKVKSLLAMQQKFRS